MVLEWTREVAMASDSAEPIERWTAKRRVELVVTILKGETSLAEAARQHGLTVAEVEEWREKFLLGAENALRSRPKDEEALKDEQIKKLKQKIGDLVVDNEILREALRPYGRIELESSGVEHKMSTVRRASRITGRQRRCFKVPWWTVIPVSFDSSQLGDGYIRSWPTNKKEPRRSECEREAFTGDEGGR
jgi:transposase-like protein